MPDVFNAYPEASTNLTSYLNTLLVSHIRHHQYGYDVFSLDHDTLDYCVQDNLMVQWGLICLYKNRWTIGG